MKIKDLFYVLRPWQWYKNLLVFLPVFFSGNLLDLNMILLSFIGFISLCLVSSSNYIINDLVDFKKDRFHPEKRKRTLASGRVSFKVKVLIICVCLAAGLGLAFFMNWIFLGLVIALFVLSQLYSFFLKKEAFVDVLVIAVNFVIRAVSGACLISVMISPWLIAGVFSFALFLGVGKRYADLAYLGQRKAAQYKEVMRSYTKESLTAFMVLSTSVLAITYLLYSFFSDYPLLVLTLPFAFYVFLRYFSLVFSGSVIARRPELVFTDVRMVLGMILWVVSAVIIIYLL